MASTIGQLNPLRYRSYVYDNETGLFYVNSRYYNPETSRYINGDSFLVTPTGLTGVNMFAYCNNNPVNKADPSGHFSISAFAAAVVAAAKKVVAAIKATNPSPKPTPTPTKTVVGAGDIRNLPKTGKPNSSDSLFNKNGSPKQMRWYDSKGDPDIDIDYNHGGDHEFPHSHKWKDGKRGPEQPVPPVPAPAPKDPSEVDSINWDPNLSKAGAYILGGALVVYGAWRAFTTGDPSTFEQGIRQFAY